MYKATPMVRNFLSSDEIMLFFLTFDISQSGVSADLLRTFTGDILKLVLVLYPGKLACQFLPSKS